jgi:hypothetical protein
MLGRDTLDRTGAKAVAVAPGSTADLGLVRVIGRVSVPARELRSPRASFGADPASLGGQRLFKMPDKDSFTRIRIWPQTTQVPAAAQARPKHGRIRGSNQPRGAGAGTWGVRGAPGAGLAHPGAERLRS